MNSTTMSSYTFTLTGNSSELSSAFFPEIALDEKSEYSCALLELTTYHSIPNVTESNNKFYFYTALDGKSPTSGAENTLINTSHVPVDSDGALEILDYNEFYSYTVQDGKSLTSGAGNVIINTAHIPVGSYEAHEILDYIRSVLRNKGFSFNYTINKNTLKTSIECTTALAIGDQFPANILTKIFGFTNSGLILENTYAESDGIIKISSQDIVRVECNIVSCSYINGRRSQSIYEFATNRVGVGYKIIERPNNLIYLPITSRRINFIQISFVDQEGEPVDFRGESITCRIHIKRDIS